MVRTAWLVCALIVLTLGMARADDEADLAAVVKKLDAEPDKVLALIETLHNDPYGPDSRPLMSVLTQYMVKSDKVQISLDGMFAQLTQSKDDASLCLFAQYACGLLKWAVQHDGKAGADDASNIAAAHHMLDAYALMLKAKPGAKNAFADKLAALDHDGKLDAFIHDTRATPKK